MGGELEKVERKCATWMMSKRIRTDEKKFRNRLIILEIGKEIKKQTLE